MAWISKYRWLQWLISGLLLGIGFIFPAVWMLGLVGGAYFLYLIQQAQSKKSLYFGAWLAWSVKSAAALIWFWSTYPIEWLPLGFGNTQLALIFMYWTTVSLWLGSGAVVVALLYKLFQRYLLVVNKYLLFFIFPLVWVIGEVLGSIMFSLMMIGPGGNINASYSLGYGGYLLAEHEVLLQFARLGGVYSLSFLFAVSCSALYVVSSMQKRSSQYIAIGILLVVYTTSFFTYFVSEDIPISEGHKVVTIDTTFPKTSARDKASSIEVSNSLSDAMKVALAEEGDYILLPEDARYFDQQRSASVVKSFFQIQFNNPNVVIVDSGRAESDGKTVLQAFIYNGPDNPVERFQKRYLVPQGEYMPSLYSKLLRSIGYQKTVDYLSSVISYEVGSNTSQSQTASNLPGVLFCFESVSPYGVRTLMKERPDMPFVAHQVSHAWFNDSNILWHQLGAMLKVQAVWNQKYIVSAGNHVSGQVFTPMGKILPLQVIDSNELWTVKSTVIPKI